MKKLPSKKKISFSYFYEFLKNGQEGAYQVILLLRPGNVFHFS